MLRRTSWAGPVGGAAAALLALSACNSSGTELALRPVTSGTIGGIAFTVTDGTVFQATADGPIYAENSGGRLVFDAAPFGLGMSDPDLLQLRTQFALSATGSLRIAAFGDAGSEFDSGLSVELRRLGGDILYEMRLGGTVFVDSIFRPGPIVASGETWVVTEFYADSVPGYGSGQSGITMWPLDDLTPSFAGDVLGCTAGPARDVGTTHAGEQVGYEFAGGWIVDAAVVDQIIGPCY